MEEIWKDISGYEGLYKISNAGRVKSSYGRKKDGILSGTINHCGYRTVRLIKNGTSKSMFVHRLVAKAFVLNNNKRPEVNHIDGIKLNNRAENLEWCTRKENAMHASNMGLYKNGSQRRNSKLSEEKVRLIKELDQKGLSKTEIAREFDVSNQAVCQVLSGKIWSWVL